MKEVHAFITYVHATSNRDLLQQIQRENLHISRIALLERLRGGRVRPTVDQTAKIMGVHRGSATRMIDELALAGFIRREPDENDGRTKRIVITEQGENVIVRLHAARIPSIQEFADRLTPYQRDKLHDAFQAILNPDQEHDHELAAAA